MPLEHNLYRCPEPCGKGPGCPYCKGGKSFCLACEQGEADLAETCPGAPPDLLTPRGVKRITYSNVEEAQQLDPDPCRAMISIRDTHWGDRTPRPQHVNLKEGWEHVLYLQFDDSPGPTPWYQGHMAHMLPEQAAAIIDFLETLPDTVTHLHVHCEAGVSRSPTVATFAHMFLRWRPVVERQRSSFCVNWHVMATLVDEVRRRVGTKQLPPYSY